MGKQSSRIYFDGADHKDIYFQGKCHDKMYIGSELVWEKKRGEDIPAWTGGWNSYYPPSSDPTIRKMTKRSQIPSYGYVYHRNGEAKSAYVVSCARDGRFITREITGIQWYYGGPFDVFRARSEPAPSLMSSIRTDKSYNLVFFLSAEEQTRWITVLDGDYGLETMLNEHLGYAILPGDGKMCRISLNSQIREVYETDFVSAETRITSSYNDEHGTLFTVSDGNLYFTEDGLNWQHVGSGFVDEIDRCTAWHNGKYLIVRGSDKALVDTSGFHYRTRPEQIEFLFTMDGYFYISYKDGVLQRTMDLIHYESLYVGKSVFGARGGTFLAPGVSGGAIMYYARINF